MPTTYVPNGRAQHVLEQNKYSTHYDIVKYFQNPIPSLHTAMNINSRRKGGLIMRIQIQILDWVFAYIYMHNNTKYALYELEYINDESKLINNMFTNNFTFIRYHY